MKKKIDVKNSTTKKGGRGIQRQQVPVSMPCKLPGL
jgi:hypothetical protein